MIRLSELRLPLAQADAPESALRAAAAARLSIPESDIAALTVFKRSFDARKADLLAVYIIDVELADAGSETTLLARFDTDPHVQSTPDMAWRPPVTAPAGWDGERPVVVGFGPCGIFAALVLAQMGLKPIVLERGKPVRERTQDTWGLWR
ncbi:MAG: FAD-dependent oxidoreductase, partial [Pseudomonadota bacterium]|nr:FAD-dependent oxidoreductase [Pseudomonadota bacterium]